jgi:hypothetical protein
VRWPVLLLLLSASAGPAQAAAAGDCVRAAAIAEREAGVPAGLLLAIGRIESGRFDPLSGTLVPSAFAVNAAGVPRFLTDATSATAYVAALEQQGIRSIDVGCFQVSLLYHPDAFPRLADGFDALANARYAAGFLAALAARSGSWELAAALYHSATPALGAPYADRVLAAWQGRMRPPPPPVPSPVSRWAGGWAAPVPVRVIVPDTQLFVPDRSAWRLPRVITPGGG